MERDNFTSGNQSHTQSQEQLASAFSGELNLDDLQVLSDQELDMVAGGRSFLNGTCHKHHHRHDQDGCFHSPTW